MLILILIIIIVARTGIIRIISRTSNKSKMQLTCPCCVLYYCCIYALYNFICKKVIQNDVQRICVFESALDRLIVCVLLLACICIVFVSYSSLLMPTPFFLIPIEKGKAAA